MRLIFYLEGTILLKLYLAMDLSDRIKVLRFEEVEIMESDFSSITEEDYMKLSDNVVDYIMGKDEKHSYLLVNINKNLRTSKRIDNGKKMVLKTAHANYTIALYNSNDLTRVVAKIVTLFSKQKPHSFNTREEALAFLLRDSKRRKSNFNFPSFRSNLRVF